jgi:hypothetical protein
MTVESLHYWVYANIFKVYDIFKEFFGEERVDLQGIKDPEEFEKYVEDYDKGNYSVEHIRDIEIFPYPFILVHYPEVTISNENGESIVIWDLFVKVELTEDGTIPTENPGFKFNRSTYNYAQYVSNYMHSHVSNIPANLGDFQSVCLGTSPINHTIETLKSGFDDTMWLMFCTELDEAVHVESLTGVPYHKMSQVSLDGGYKIDTNTNRYMLLSAVSPDPKLKDFMKEFILYYIEHGHMIISYAGVFKCGMTNYDFLLDVSDCFIEFCNDKIKKGEVAGSELFNTFIQAARVKDYALYGKGNTSRIRNAEDRHLFTFKGNDIKLKIIHDSEDTGLIYIMNTTLANTVKDTIINIINYRYGSNEERVTGTYKEAVYL